ncbi:hypothetical protein OG607_21070 [Streptomyces sp. NBC_01537]
MYALLLFLSLTPYLLLGTLMCLSWFDAHAPAAVTGRVRDARLPW